MGENEKTCVFSGSVDNLNTSMKITIGDGQVVEVWISDEYADQATPRAIKEAYLAKYPVETAEMKMLRELAAKLGMQLVSANQPLPVAPQPGIVMPVPPIPAPVKRTIQALPPIVENKLEPMEPGNRIISGKQADSKDVSGMIHVTATDSKASAAGGVQNQYTVTSVSKPSQDLKEGEVVEIGQAPGRGGVPVAIPVRRSGKTGTTNVRILNTGGDIALQKRFKGMAEASKNDNDGRVKHFGKEGYDSRTVRCPLCGTNPNAAPNPKCKKCQGLGEILIVQEF